ncbi:MAG: hypothetical protein JWQ14_239, partial [Adhaeribacter sp.]|nr:hypothetical protein [Adhaeribacter sp.]
IWSVINLVPVSVFCYTLLDLTWLYAFIGISLLPMFFPNSFLNKMQLGKTTATYKKLGVDIINKVTQNGDYINRLVRKRFPAYRAITYQRSSVNKLLQQTYMYEKFHFMMFVFFGLTTGYALSHHYFGWAFIISITNVVYNIYPNLLQQYIRLKLLLFSQKRKATNTAPAKFTCR